MINRYPEIIKLLVKRNYKNSNIFNDKFLNLYNQNRVQLKKKIIQIKSQNFKRNDSTYFKFLKIYNKKKLSKSDESFILNMYKKFEINLSLKKSYNKLVKTSNKNSTLISVFLLEKILSRTKKLNSLQKLNFYLKLNDQLIFFKEKINKFEKKLILKSLNNEKKIFEKIERK